VRPEGSVEHSDTGNGPRTLERVWMGRADGAASYVGGGTDVWRQGLPKTRNRRSVGMSDDSRALDTPSRSAEAQEWRMV
jgi:hypothetical protein